jgi:hypothetical protein
MIGPGHFELKSLRLSSDSYARQSNVNLRMTDYRKNTTLSITTGISPEPRPTRNAQGRDAFNSRPFKEKPTAILGKSYRYRSLRHENLALFPDIMKIIFDQMLISTRITKHTKLHQRDQSVNHLSTTRSFQIVSLPLWPEWH